MSHSILFVVHAGRGIGLGHLTRSLVAARAVTRCGVAQVDFVAVGYEIDLTIQNVCDFPIRTMEGPIDEVIGRLTEGKRFSVLCVDLFPKLISPSLEPVLKKLRWEGCRVVVIDGLPGCEDSMDLLYVPSCLSPLNLQTRSFHGRLFFGWDAFLLNIDLRKSWSPSNSNSILVLTGGSDTTRLGNVWPEIFSTFLPKNSRVDWITGPFADPPTFPSTEGSMKFVEHVAPASLSNLMHRTGIAASVFGVSFFELIALGVPTVVFSPYGEKDARVLSEIQKEGIALVASDANDVARQASMLVTDRDLQVELSKRARNRIRSFDGQHFAREIRELLVG